MTRPTSRATREYQRPQLFLIGDANDVVLGVAGGGDDFMGYTEPELEYESDLLVDWHDNVEPSTIKTRAMFRK